MLTRYRAWYLTYAIINICLGLFAPCPSTYPPEIVSWVGMPIYNHETERTYLQPNQNLLTNIIFRTPNTRFDAKLAISICLFSTRPYHITVLYRMWQFRRVKLKTSYHKEPRLSLHDVMLLILTIISHLLMHSIAKTLNSSVLSEIILIAKQCTKADITQIVYLLTSYNINMILLAAGLLLFGREMETVLDIVKAQSLTLHFITNFDIRDACRTCHAPFFVIHHGSTIHTPISCPSVPWHHESRPMA